MKENNKVDSIEKLAVLVAEGFEQMDRRFESIEERLDRLENDLSDIRRRVERLKELGAGHAGFAKEIDHILVRIAKIEEKVGIHRG